MASDLVAALRPPFVKEASTDGTPGSNGNLLSLIALQNQPLVNGQTPTDYYANLIDQIGSDAANATAEQQASSQTLQQLQNQQGAVSGVSLDEEAANLINYQRAYEAAARVVSVVDEMTSSLMKIANT